jgi:pimeloyl-ACP methyl ester carboxylesterase
MTYVLIPGAGGTAWTWHLVEAELRQRGHEVVAVDLPADDDEAGLPEYTAAVITAIGDRTDLVLVAQSMGAYTAPLVCEQLSEAVSLMVLVNPMIPRAGETAGEWWTNTGQLEARRENDLLEGRSPDADFDVLTIFFHDVAQEVIDQAGSHSPRQSDTPFGQPWPLAAWPEVPTRLLTSRDDRLFPVQFQRRVALERLGITPDELPGGHLTALSYPTVLADRLEAMATQEGTASPRRRRAARNRRVNQPSKTRRSGLGHQPIEEVAAELDRLVTTLIKENRDLRRQVDRLSKQAVSGPSGTVERTLRSIVRRLRNALTTTGRRSASRGTRARAATADPELLERRRQALAKAREAMAAKRAATS